MKIIDKIKLLLLLYKHRKGFEYCKKNCKVPMCSCNDYYTNWNCEHLDKLRLEFNKFIWK